MLRHLVMETLAGRQDSLKERVLAVEIFGRSGDYDSTEDSTVRVAVHELRRRLQQYEQRRLASGPPPSVRIQLLHGSYIPAIELKLPTGRPADTETAPAEPERPEPEQPLPRSPGWRWLVAIFLGVALLAAGWLLFAPAMNPVREFWSPVLQSGKPVLIMVGLPAVYRCSGPAHQKLISDYFAAGRARGFTAPTPESGCESLTMLNGQFAGVGDTLAISHLSRFLNQEGVSSSVRFTNDVSYTDLKQGPSVLIGAFSNLWTLRITEGARFSFVLEDGSRLIRDKQDPRRRLMPANYAVDGSLTEDYGIAMRIVESTGSLSRIIIVLAGLTQYGTGAAAELVTNPQLVEHGLLKGSGGKDIQILCRVPVVDGVAGTPQVVTVHRW